MSYLKKLFTADLGEMSFSSFYNLPLQRKRARWSSERLLPMIKPRPFKFVLFVKLYLNQGAELADHTQSAAIMAGRQIRQGLIIYFALLIDHLFKLPPIPDTF